VAGVLLGLLVNGFGLFRDMPPRIAGAGQLVSVRGQHPAQRRIHCQSLHLPGTGVTITHGEKQAVGAFLD
jgi:hypothetical protein